LSYTFLSTEDFAMTLSVRLDPALERLLDRACRQRKHSRSALVQEALREYLEPSRPRLGAVIREVLADSPQGLGIERAQPAAPEAREKVR
jgi:predicted transcriptional regulator